MLDIPLYTAVHNIWCIGVPYCGFKNKFVSNWSYFFVWIYFNEIYKPKQTYQLVLRRDKRREQWGLTFTLADREEIRWVDFIDVIGRDILWGRGLRLLKEVMFILWCVTGVPGKHTNI